MGNREARPHWKEDVNYCSKCKLEIGFLTRHHCRNCGNVFCDECSAYSHIVQLYYDDQVPRRVCKSCYEYLKRYKYTESYSPSLKKAIDSKIGLENFDLLTIVGTGKYGKVVKVQEKATGKIFAMKVLNKKNILYGGEVQHTIAERNILMKIRHPFLMRLHYAFQTTEKLALVMDFVNGGDLFYHLQLQPARKFDNDRVCFYAAEIALGIEHLHEMGILYRDLKPENVLIDADGHIRLTDFGLSKEGFYKTNDRTSTFCGTPEYLAPEILAGGDYNNAVDWWAFGAIIYEMLTGWAPFYTKDVQKMYKLKITARIGVPDYVQPQAKHLLLRLLDRNPDTRMTDPEKIKTHPWFSKIDWQKLYKKEIEPPFKPILASTHSTEMFDPDFTQKNIENEIGNTQDPAIDDTTDNLFKDYTYYENETETGSWPPTGHAVGKLNESTEIYEPSKSLSSSCSNIKM